VVKKIKAMQKNKKHLIIFGIVMNLLFVSFFALFPIKYYKGWDTFKKTNLDNWLATDEQFLHFVFYQAFPAAAVVMIISAIIIWKLRK
jgi:hypothetical protein